MANIPADAKLEKPDALKNAVRVNSGPAIDSLEKKNARMARHQRLHKEVLAPKKEEVKK